MPPSIPTSFVPRPSEGRAAERAGISVGLIAIGAYVALALAVALAVGVFLYGRILSAELASQDAALMQARSAIDATTVESFVRLRDRLSSSKQLLGAHTAFSEFFTALGSVLPATVRFTSLAVTIDDKNAAVLSANGVATTFNALAAASSALAKDGRIKDAIFSDITIQTGKGVAFALSATLDSSLLAYRSKTSVLPSTPAGIPPPSSASATSTTP